VKKAGNHGKFITVVPAQALENQSPWGRPEAGWRLAAYRIIFQSDTPAGGRFDIALVALILASVAVVILDSVVTLERRWNLALHALEWTFTVLFTAEYLLRLWCVRRPARYARSFFGVVDLLAVLPTWLAVLAPGLQALIDVRILRLLRVFRIFKLTAFIGEYQVMAAALAASWRKILVFLSTVIFIVVVMGTVMYVVEGRTSGFESIPAGIYWAITTMTTVGFGDITPKTELGRFIASVMLLLGWGTLAVPTGIVTAEMTLRRRGGRSSTRHLAAVAAARALHARARSSAVDRPWSGRRRGTRCAPGS
jgi:voltage-gated potassium channel